MKCPYCGTDNPAGEDFCGNCGGYLNSNIAPTTVSPSPTGNSNSGGRANSGNSGTLTANARLQNGRYVVDKILGQGGMGAAVLARDTRVSNKPVVIKELVSDSTDPAQQKEDVRNFEREVETLAKIDHPLVPTVTDSFQEGSRYFMVQEYAAGENLEHHIERIHQPMPESEVLAYASQVLDILDYLSQQTPPIIHRDIKPANIIIGNKDKRAHLVDFGIARADEAKNAQRKQTSALGTPGYAPPEQYQGNADARSDLYALAATLHHVLTNRDPRDYPPFTYPPARSLNPKLTPDIERILERALMIDATKRYQNAAAMKHDIDDLLARRFRTTADTGSYTFGNIGAATTKAQPARQVPPPPPPPIQRQAPPSYGSRGYGVQQPPPRQYPQQQQQAGIYAAPPAAKQQSGGYVLRSFLLLIIAVALIGGAFLILPRLTSSRPGTGGNGPGSVPTLQPFSNGIGVTTVNNEPIGISDGTFAFDTNRDSGDLKRQASDKLANKDSSGAQSLWQAAVNKDSRDAEALIYWEDQRVLGSGRPYLTFVVGVMLTGPDAGVGRDTLQGAYIAQKEYNANGGDKLGGVQVRLLIANAGGSSNNATSVAQQIVQATQADPTIVGVMGWPFSSYSQNAIPVLARAQIPMVSSTASSNALTGVSPYFFRVAPADSVQATVGAQYARNKLKSSKAVIFVDQEDSYSQSLATAFSDQFTQLKGEVIDTENYKKGDSGSIAQGLRHALGQVPAPDMIYFAGYASDVTTLLTELPKYTDFPNLPVMGGDAMYELGGYSQAARESFNRLHFTSFAYPDEWEILRLGDSKPAFFTDYATTYTGPKKQTGYGYTRTSNDVMLSFDAMNVLLVGSKNALAGQTKTTPNAVQKGLTQIKGANAVQGVSGQIAFDNNGDPVDKAIVMLAVDPQGHIRMEEELGAGKFTVP